MTYSTIALTFTQCKQIVANDSDLRDTVEALNNQPDFMQGVMSVDSISELQSILQCGCAGNAHKSVYYYEAGQAMAEHGDDVLEYLEDTIGEIPTPPEGCSWNSLASHYLSTAIELWCGQFVDSLEGVDWD